MPASVPAWRNLHITDYTEPLYFSGNIAAI